MMIVMLMNDYKNNSNNIDVIAIANGDGDNDDVKKWKNNDPDNRNLIN